MPHCKMDIRFSDADTDRSMTPILHDGSAGRILPDPEWNTMREKVTVCEVGPRDGLQMAKSIMPTAAKSRWIAAIAAAGVPEIEVGSFVPARLIPQMADTAEIVQAAVAIPGLLVVALTPNLRGAQAAHAAGAHRVSVPVSVSEGHSRANLNRSPEEQVAEVARIVAWVREHAPAMQVEAACSTAFGCSIDGVIPEAAVLRIAEGLVAAGADEVALADTVGYAHPAQVRSLVRATRAAIGDKLGGLHLHDTMGLGLANALVGLEEGVRNFDAALAGLGGCPFAPGASGNIVTEDLVFMLESMGFATGVDLERLIAARALLHEGLPDEPMHGQVPRAGIPRTFRAAA
jgi:hydroxymethylglutaryl-CoA lyase